MNTLLENHVTDERRARNQSATQAFEQRYATLLPLLKASDVQCFVEQEPAAEGGRQWAVIFRWAGGYLYTQRWPMLPTGAVEQSKEPIEPGVLAELVLAEVSNWDKWAAAQAWRDKRLYWLGWRVLLGYALVIAGGLLLVAGANASAWCSLITMLVPYLGLRIWLSFDRYQRFPKGMFPRPAHILHHSKIKRTSERQVFSSSTGQYAAAA